MTHPTPRSVPHPGELPPDAVSASGWCFEVYHPHCDYPDIQVIEASVACTHTPLEVASEKVLDLVHFLIRTHRMAGRVDGDVPGIGWTPYGPVTTPDGHAIHIGRLDRSVERPAVTMPETDFTGADTAIVPFPAPRLSGVRCEDGWMMSYRRLVVDAPTQIVALRAVCGEPNLDTATEHFGQWVGGLAHAGLLAMSIGAPTIRTSVDPLGAATAPDGQRVTFA